MIEYEYETLQGQRIAGFADHIKVRYTEQNVTVLMLDGRGNPLNAVDIVPTTSMSFDTRDHETTRFVCERFTINGKDLTS